jgi:predicted DNA-binding antitoxin AbrB/MazE fold protein
MVQSIRAIYEKGKLRLLEPVDLSEGQEIQVMILSERSQAEVALGDLLIDLGSEISEDINEADLMREIDTDFRGQPPLSQTIIDERRTGP